MIVESYDMVFVENNEWAEAKFVNREGLFSPKTRVLDAVGLGDNVWGC